MTNKMPRLLCIVFFFGICIVSKVSGQSASLAISPPVKEERPQTLVCLYSGAETVTVVTWIANEITQGSLKVNGTCSELSWPHKELLKYSCDVGKKMYILIISNVTRNNRNDVWKCTIDLDGIRDSIHSNNVRPSVKVPITSVTMTLPQSNTVTTQEKTTQQFTCVTSGGLPEPIVKWYNDSRSHGDTSDDKEITTLITSSYSNTSDDLVITTSILTLTTSKYDNRIKIYCSAYSYLDQTPLTSTQKPEINVLYRANVTDFYVVGFPGKTSVTVTETTSAVQFHCAVDSNPGSSMTIKKEDQQLHLDVDIKSLEYLIPSTSCIDAGIYTCLGNNRYNTEHSSKQITLHVNCSPRKSPLVPLFTDVTTKLNKLEVLSFTALAYPIPSRNDFRWFRNANGQWLNLLNDAIFKIDTQGLQSNLTILFVNKYLFGLYLLTVKNTIGHFEQIFHIIPEDKPEEPTEFIHKQELVTESSFTVQWKPGFDNGREQFFILKYRKESQQRWAIVSIPYTGGTLMNYTASALSSGANYQVVLYASNIIGNSSETDMLHISTKDIPERINCTTDHAQTIIVGAVFGIVSVVLSVYASYVTVLLRRIKRTQGQTFTKVLKGNVINTQKFVNLAHSRNNSTQLQSTEQSDAAEYTTLDNRLRGDSATYDDLNTAY